MRDGTAVTFRPIRPEDEPLMARFHEGLSEETVRCRYGGLMKLGARVAHERLARMCFTDYDRQIALVADRTTDAGAHEILAVARLIRGHGDHEAELAVVVADRWQRRGLGARLLELLIGVARAERLERITARVFPESHVMLRLCEKAGFTIARPGVEGEIEWHAELKL
jgi:acetyltransferase